MSVVLGGEAVIGVNEVQGGLVVAQQGLLLFLRAVEQRVRMDLLDVPLDGTNLQCSQSGSTNHADQSVSPTVIIHQVLHPPAHLVVSSLVFSRVMAMTRGGGCIAGVL